MSGEHDPNGEKLEALEADLLECKTEVGKELERGNIRMNELQDKIDSISASIEELLSIFRAANGFAKVMGWIGKILKWCAAIGVAVLAFWAALKGVQK